MTRTEPFPWSDAFLLGCPPMDETHREFVELVNSMLSCPDAERLERLRAFAQHAERHFGDELVWMQASGLPAMRCHVAEHAAVLESLEHVLRLADGGDLAIARRLAVELARWFPEHATHMDAALAQWLVGQGSDEARLACAGGIGER